MSATPRIQWTLQRETLVEADMFGRLERITIEIEQMRNVGTGKMRGRAREVARVRL